MKHRILFKNYLSHFLAYRARVGIWAVTDVAEFLVFPFIWLAVITDNIGIEGYGRADIITYYLIAAFVSLVFTSHPARKVKEDIMQGGLNAFLVKPLGHFSRHLIEQATYKILSLGIGLGLMLPLVYFLPEYTYLPLSWTTWVFFTLSLLIAFFVSHLLEYTLGLASFWFGEIRALQHVLEIASILFSGRLAPLVFFPPLFASLAEWLPFAALASIPADIYLERMTAAESVGQLSISALWLFVLSGLAILAWKRGLRRYEGIGI